VVTAYYVSVSDAAVVSVFVSAEIETSSNSVTTEISVLIVDVAQQWTVAPIQIFRLSGRSPQYCDMTPESRNSEVRIDFIARQRLGKHIPAATNTQATIE
jgi:hypothetical protein